MSADLPYAIAPEAANLQIELLGHFRVSAAGIELPADVWRGRNAAQLVKRLALAPDHAMLREQLIDFLWPDADIASASNSLRQTLHLARRQLRLLPLDSTQILRSYGERVQLYPADQCWTDVHAFELATQAARLADDPALYWSAIERYTGTLLPEDVYEDWTTFCRESLES